MNRLVEERMARHPRQRPWPFPNAGAVTGRCLGGVGRGAKDVHFFLDISESVGQGRPGAEELADETPKVAEQLPDASHGAPEVLVEVEDGILTALMPEEVADDDLP